MPSNGLTKSLPVRMDEALNKRLQVIADFMDRDKSWVIRKALTEFLPKAERQMRHSQRQPSAGPKQKLQTSDQ